MAVRDLDIGLLRTFLAVADRENFAGAADQVFRTQAAVSQQMQRLERLLDCKLLVRVGRHKRLTEQGVRLREYARRMLALNDETCRAMNKSVFAAPTRIGVCADAVDTILPDYLALCARTYPGMRIEIQVNRSRWLASALRRGDIDLLLELEQFDEFPRVTFRTSPVVWISGTHFHHQQNLHFPLLLVDSPCVFRLMALNRL
jgi:DNA-binding transcriptional LysR family regulator